MPTPPSDAIEQRLVLAAEDAYVAAEVRRDEAALRRLIDDAFVYNAHTGTTTGKEAFIAGILTMHMVGQTIRERTVHVEGPVALVFGTADLRFGAADGSETVSSLRYTSVYAKREGGWRMLALQMQARAAG